MVSAAMIGENAISHTQTLSETSAGAGAVDRRPRGESPQSTAAGSLAASFDGSARSSAVAGTSHADWVVAGMSHADWAGAGAAAGAGVSISGASTVAPGAAKMSSGSAG